MGKLDPDMLGEQALHDDLSLLKGSVNRWEVDPDMPPTQGHNEQPEMNYVPRFLSKISEL